MSDSLADARSPFLQHGATQPVRWLPWGDAAFERARRENKPILLDIGAAWCHWCHVMDRESYEDPDTAALINEFYVPVKVDRDERPDVDTRYQRAVQTLTGQGGWPLTAFLTPDGETYYGGTYFPPSDQAGRPSFKRVLVEVARIWREEPQRAVEAVTGIRERLRNYAAAEAEAGTAGAELVAQTVEDFAQAFDFRYGGFGRAPKFPNPGGLALLLDHHLDSGLEWSSRMVTETLDAMARGGIYDQIGGGFHRYATDARWLIPHFEKMAYDNGPLLEVYARAYASTGSALYLEIVRGIVAYYFDIASDLLASGGFPASQDADYSPTDDGDYWTWTHDEVRRVLSADEANVAIAYFGLDDPASAMHLDPARHVLYRARVVDDSVVEHEIAAQLKRARDARPQPFVDKSVYTGWSALVASGFIAAGRYAGQEQAAQPALHALEQMWANSFDASRGVAHRAGDPASGVVLEDQAFVLQALLDAFEYTQDERWLKRARALSEIVELRFAEAGAYRDRPRDAAAPAASLAEPHYPIADSPTPSGNGMMALNLLRLAALTHEDTLRARAAALLNAFAGSGERLSTSASTYVRAVSWLTRPVVTVVVTGTGAPQDEPLFRAAASQYRPRMVLRYFRADAIVPDQIAPELRAMVTDQAPRAYVCAGNVCAPPVRTTAELANVLSTHNVRWQD